MPFKMPWDDEAEDTSFKTGVPWLDEPIGIHEIAGVEITVPMWKILVVCAGIFLLLGVSVCPCLFWPC